MSQDKFDFCFNFTVGVEGGFQNNPNDRGNWTGGEVGVGENKGTNFGISAAAYPNLDIAGLTIQDAQAIYQTDYWNKVSCDQLPQGLDVLVFDTAVNSGVEAAGRLLQEALGMPVVQQDGDIGPVTQHNVQTAIAVNGVHGLMSEFQARRNVALTENPTEWAENGLGWSRRLFTSIITAVTNT